MLDTSLRDDSKVVCMLKIVNNEEPRYGYACFYSGVWDRSDHMLSCVCTKLSTIYLACRLVYNRGKCLLDSDAKRWGSSSAREIENSSDCTFLNRNYDPADTNACTVLFP